MVRGGGSPAMSGQLTERNTMPSDVHVERLLVIDFGAQYTQLIARRIREAGVYCEIHPFDAPEDFIRDFGARGIVLSGGPETVTEDATPRIPDVVFELRDEGTPLLGICYGMQALAQQLGGRVQGSQKREFGHARIRVSNGSSLLSNLPSMTDGELDVWMSHGDKVVVLPDGFETTASTASARRALPTAMCCERSSRASTQRPSSSS